MIKKTLGVHCVKLYSIFAIGVIFLCVHFGSNIYTTCKYVYHAAFVFLFQHQTWGLPCSSSFLRNCKLKLSCCEQSVQDQILKKGTILIKVRRAKASYVGPQSPYLVPTGHILMQLCWHPESICAARTAQTDVATSEVMTSKTRKQSINIAILCCKFLSNP